MNDSTQFFHLIKRKIKSKIIFLVFYQVKQRV